MKYIGLIGLAGSGKDTAAKALKELYFQRVAFADQVKNIAFDFGWNGLKDKRGRKLLQDLGMAGRAYKESIWIDYVHEETVGFGNHVFTDVRFQNEADYIRGLGGIIVRIVRPGIISGNHESELKQCEIPADIEIVNDGSIEDLHDKIRAILTK